jgi:hypothetical protein
MFSVEKCAVPVDTLLDRYRKNESYADCYRTEIPKAVSINQFIFRFYTTFLFKLERWILTWIVAKPSTDSQAKQLADCDIDEFAAWHVEDRNESELLMCDLRGRTRSWFMVMRTSTNPDRTRLYFGSAVVPTRNRITGKLTMGLIFRALLGFHQIYSVLLLYAAKSRIARSR